MGNFCSMGASKQAKKEAAEDNTTYEKPSDKPEENVLFEQPPEGGAEATIPTVSIGDGDKDGATQPLLQVKTEGNPAITIDHSELTDMVSEGIAEMKGGGEKIGVASPDQVILQGDIEDKKEDKPDETKSENEAGWMSGVQQFIGDTQEKVQDSVSTEVAAKSKDIQESMEQKTKEVGEAIRTEITSKSEDIQSSLAEKAKDLGDTVQSEVTAKSTDFQSALGGFLKGAEDTVEKTSTEVSAKNTDFESALGGFVKDTEDTVEEASTEVTARSDDFHATVADAKTDVSGMIDSVKEITEQGIATASQSVTETADSMKDKTEKEISAATQNIDKKVSETSQNITETVDSVKETAEKKVEDVSQDVQTSVTEASKTVGTELVHTKQNIENEITAVGKDVEKSASEAEKTAVKTVDSAQENVGGAVTSISQKVETSITETNKDIGETIDTLTESAAEGVAAERQEVEAGVAEISENVTDAFVHKTQEAQGDMTGALSEIGKTVETGVVAKSNELQSCLADAAGDLNKIKDTEDKVTGVVDFAAENIHSLSSSTEEKDKNVDLLGEISQNVEKQTPEQLKNLIGSAVERSESGVTTQLWPESATGEVTSEISEAAIDQQQGHILDTQRKQLAVTRNSDGSVTTKDVLEDTVAVLPESPIAEPNPDESGKSAKEVDNFFTGLTDTVKTAITSEGEKVVDLISSAIPTFGSFGDDSAQVEEATGEKSDTELIEKRDVPTGDLLGTDDTSKAVNDTTDSSNGRPEMLGDLAGAPESMFSDSQEEEKDGVNIEEIAAQVTSEAVEQAIKIVSEEEASGGEKIAENGEESEQKIPSDQSDGSITEVSDAVSGSVTSQTTTDSATSVERPNEEYNGASPDDHSVQKLEDLAGAAVVGSTKTAESIETSKNNAIENTESVQPFTDEVISNMAPRDTVLTTANSQTCSEPGSAEVSTAGCHAAEKVLADSGETTPVPVNGTSGIHDDVLDEVSGVQGLKEGQDTKHQSPEKPECSHSVPSEVQREAII